MIHTLNLDELDRLIDDDKTNAEVKKAIEIFLTAMNDWPIAIYSCGEYVSEVEKFIGGVANKRSLSSRNFNVMIHAWNAESMSEMVEIYNIYPDTISLSEILDDMNAKINI